MIIQYRYPHGERSWSTERTVTIEELWDGSTFDYQPIVVGNQDEYHYLCGLELVLGEKLHELVYDHDFSKNLRWSVEVRILNLNQG